MPVSIKYCQNVCNSCKCIRLNSLTGQTLIIGAKESGETHAKVVSHDRMLSCQSDSL